MCRYMGGWTLDDLRALSPDEYTVLFQMITAERPE
jgi:hypothetical protein